MLVFLHNNFSYPSYWKFAVDLNLASWVSTLYCGNDHRTVREASTLESRLTQSKFIVGFPRIRSRRVTLPVRCCRAVVAYCGSVFNREYSSISAKTISAKVHIRQISAPLNCIFTRKSLAHLTALATTLEGAHSAQFKKFKRFINDEMLYRVTNKNHHGKT